MSKSHVHTISDEPVAEADQRPTVRILGTHGVPGGLRRLRDGGRARGPLPASATAGVVVYCQLPGTGPIRTDEWNGIERILVR